MLTISYSSCIGDFMQKPPGIDLEDCPRAPHLWLQVAVAVFVFVTTFIRKLRRLGRRMTVN